MSGELRPKNRALEYLVQHYQTTEPRLRLVVAALPQLASSLYAEAEESAKNLLMSENENPLAKSIAKLFGHGKSSKQTLLANCVLDLQLSSCFGEFSKYFENHEIASLVIDALLYQATGSEATSPTDDEILLGTQNARGIHKFQLARRKMPHMASIESWMFGKEYGAIKFDNPIEIGNILSVSSFAFATRVQAFWRARELLYDVAPTEGDRQKLREDLAENDKNLIQMMETFSRPQE
jgi:hypothetical protein